VSKGELEASYFLRKEMFQGREEARQVSSLSALFLQGDLP